MRAPRRPGSRTQTPLIGRPTPLSWPQTRGSSPPLDQLGTLAFALFPQKPGDKSGLLRVLRAWALDQPRSPGGHMEPRPLCRAQRCLQPAGFSCGHRYRLSSCPQHSTPSAHPWKPAREHVFAPQVTVLESLYPLVPRKPYVPSEPVGTPRWPHACTLGECTQPGEFCTLALCTIRGPEDSSHHHWAREYLENSFVWLHAAYSLLSGPTGDSGALGTHPRSWSQAPGSVPSSLCGPGRCIHLSGPVSPSASKENNSSRGCTTSRTQLCKAMYGGGRNGNYQVMAPLFWELVSCSHTVLKQ